MEELFRKNLELQEQRLKLEEEYYKNASKISLERESIVSKMIEIKLNTLGISLGDKVIDKKSNQAYIVGVDFRQKPHTYLKNKNEITFDDFEFRGEYKDIKKDGSMSKKEPIISLDFYSLKTCCKEKKIY